MAEEIQEAVQIIRVAYDGIEIAMKVGSGGIAAMQKAIDFLKRMLDYEKSLGKTSMRKLLLKGDDLQVLQFNTEDMKKVEKISCRGLWMLTESFGRSTTENHSGRDKQVPAVKDCRFTQTAFGTVVHDSSGKWLGQYETEDAAVEMLREMAKDDGGYSDEI